MLGDEKAMKMKPLRVSEEIFLMRSCLKDGMSQKQAEGYIIAMKKEVEHNHKLNLRRIRSVRKRTFKEEFKKMKKGKR